MPSSNLSPVMLIAENSEATPGLFNAIFSTLSSNIDAINSNITLQLAAGSGNTLSVLTNLNVIGQIQAQGLSIGSTPPSVVTTAGITIAVNSNQSDYLYLVDSSNQRSSYVIGSRAGGAADGLALWDASGATMIANFSKQSIRFYQKIVGPVFDVGGAFFNVIAYGAKADGVTNDSGAIQDAINAANAAGGGTVFFPAATYLITSSLSLYNDITLTGWPRATRILCNGASSVDAITIGAAKRCNIHGIFIDGTGVNRHGINIVNGDDFRMFNSWIKSQGSHGIVINNSPSLILGSTFELNGGHGLYYTQTNSGEPPKIIGNFFSFNTLHGIFGEANANEAVIMGNEIVSNVLSGIRLLNASRYNKIIGNAVLGNSQHGIQLDLTCEYNSIIGNEVVGNSQYGIDITTNSDFCMVLGNAVNDNNKTDSTTTFSGLRVNSSTFPAIIGNTFHNTLAGRYQNYGIYLNSVAAATLVSNSFSQNSIGAISGAATTQNTAFNQGYVEFLTDSAVKAIAGSAVQPGLTFASEVSLGWYRSAASAIGLSYGQLELPDGTALAPSRAFSSESSLGWYRSGTSTLALSYGTALLSTLSMTGQIAASTYTATGAITTAGAITSQGASGAIKLGKTDGSQGQLTLSGGDTYFDYLGTLRARSITGGTSTVLTFATADGRGDFTNGIFIPSGSAANPADAFSSEKGLGWYRSGVSTMALSYGTFNLNQARTVSMRTLAASSLTASAANTNTIANECGFTVGGASGASLFINSGGTTYIFNSALSAANA